MDSNKLTLLDRPSTFDLVCGAPCQVVALYALLSGVMAHFLPQHYAIL